MVDILNKQLDIDDDGIYAIVNIIKANGGKARLVGGVVRDALLHLPCKDIDIATDLLPQQIIDIFGKSGYKTIPTGIKFGTVMVVIAGNSYEITTLRQDIKTDGRHAEVFYTKSYQKDAARRDFTINALSYDLLEHKIYDYFDGLKDLDQRRVRFIGSAELRIQEDYLRILRFFRFTAYYANEIDHEGLEACQQYAHDMQKLSAERIKAELDRLIMHRNSVDILRVLCERGLWKYILHFDNFDVSLLENAWNISDQIKVGLIDSTLYALMMISQRPLSVKGMLDRRFSRIQIKTIDGFYKFIDDIINNQNKENQDNQGEMRSNGDRKIKFNREIKVELITRWLESDDDQWQQYFIILLAMALSKTVISDDNLFDNQEIISLYSKLESNNNKVKPTFPLRAQSLVNLGITGRQIGLVLLQLRRIWIANDFALTAEQLQQMAIDLHKISK